MNRSEQAEKLRRAVIGMAIRYGSSQQNAAYADRHVRDGKAGAEAKYRRHYRAARRQFAAIQRLASALANLAGSTR